MQNLLVETNRRDQSPILVQLYRTIVEYEGCSKIPNISKCVNVLKIIVDSLITDKKATEEFSNILVSVINNKGKSSNPEILTSLKPAIFKLFEKGDLQIVKKIDGVLQDTTHYFHSYLSAIVTAYERVEPNPSTDPLELKNQAIKCVSEAVMRQNGFYHMIKKEEHLFSGFGSSMWFYEKQKKIIRPLNLAGLLNKTQFNWYELLYIYCRLRVIFFWF